MRTHVAPGPSVDSNWESNLSANTPGDRRESVWRTSSSTASQISQLRCLLAAGFCSYSTCVSIVSISICLLWLDHVPLLDLMMLVMVNNDPHVSVTSVEEY